MTYSAECKNLLDPNSAAHASNVNNSRVIYLKKVGSALFYGIASFFITVVNKTVLTSWKFPSFLVLSIGQMVAGIVILVSITSPWHTNLHKKCFYFQQYFFLSSFSVIWQANWHHLVCRLFKRYT